MNTDQYFEIKSEKEEFIKTITQPIKVSVTIEIIPQKEMYMGKHVIYWFTNKDDILKWVRNVSAAEDFVHGTVEEPRFGGNFIDVEPELFEKFINWVFDDSKRIGLAGYTGGDNDLTIEEILIDPKDGITTKSIRRKGHISKADEVSDTEEGYVRCWWD